MTTTQQIILNPGPCVHQSSVLPSQLLGSLLPRRSCPPISLPLRPPALIPTLRSVSLSLSLSLSSITEPPISLLPRSVHSERTATVLRPGCRLTIQCLDDGVNVIRSCYIDKAVVVIAWFGSLRLMRCAKITDICDLDAERVDECVDCLFDVGGGVNGGEVAKVESFDWSLGFLVAVAVLEGEAGLAISAPPCSLERRFTAFCATISLLVVKYG